MLWRKPRSVLGIDFGSHSVKIVELAVSKGDPMIVHGTLIPLPHDEPNDDIASQIRAYLDSVQTRTKRAVIALPASSGEVGNSDNVVWQILERPEIPPDVRRQDLLSTMRVELGDFIAYDPEDAVFDCQVLYPTPDGEGSFVLLVITHRELVEQRVEILRKASLQPMAVDLDFFALERVAEFTGQLNKQNQALLMDIGENKTTVGFYQWNRLQAIFDFHAGGRNVTSELQRNLHLDYVDAEEAKRTRIWIERSTGDDDSPGSFIEAIASLDMDTTYLGSSGAWEIDPAVVNALDDQRIGICPPLRACVDSYETDFPDAQISTMILAGGTAQLYNFPELLMDRFGVRAERISYADRFLWPIDNALVRDIQANEPIFAVALGLAMKRLALNLQAQVNLDAEPPETFEHQVSGEGADV